MTEIVVGTAALGMRYGLARPDGSSEHLTEEQAISLIQNALAAGLGTFDTAPAYGDAERRLGLALEGRGHVWTKVGAVSLLCDEVSRGISASIDRSLELLRRARIDVLQWHNWTPVLATDEGFRGAWRAFADDPRIDVLGATTYGIDDALCAVESELFRNVQVEWNLLNQGVVARVAPSAIRRGVSISVRSILLQGALTNEGRALPQSPELAGGVARARKLAEALCMPLEELAIRSALSHPEIDHVLVGIDRASQLGEAAGFLTAPRLPADVLTAVGTLDMGGHPATDPRRWNV